MNKTESFVRKRLELWFFSWLCSSIVVRPRVSIIFKGFTFVRTTDVIRNHTPSFLLWESTPTTRDVSPCLSSTSLMTLRPLYRFCTWIERTQMSSRGFYVKYWPNTFWCDKWKDLIYSINWFQLVFIPTGKT